MSDMFIRVLREKRDATERDLDGMAWLAPWVTEHKRDLLAMLNAEIARRIVRPPPSIDREAEYRGELRRLSALRRAFIALDNAPINGRLTPK